MTDWPRYTKRAEIVVAAAGVPGILQPEHITPGAVNTEVTVELPGGAEVVSVITKASAERLHLAPGMEVYAVIKASDVMIATD